MVAWEGGVDDGLIYLVGGVLRYLKGSLKVFKNMVKKTLKIK